MNILCIDWDGVGLAFCMRAQDAGNSVRLWLPKHGAVRNETGDGIVPRVDEWKPSMKWAQLIVLTDNSHLRAELRPFFEQDFPIFGANDAAAELELDREVGQQIFEQCGVDTLPYETFSDFDKAIAFVKKTELAYCVKPWGGTGDKALTYLAKTPADLVFTLERWRDSGKVKGEFMLQQKADGIEMGIAGWFGPGGWGKWLEEHWEHKKLLNDDLGCNTGEQGTVIRYTKKSSLFDAVLKPLTRVLEKAGYVGDVAVNTIIDEDGIPWPLELTVRLGWPDFNIRMALHDGDPVEWMYDLWRGRDTLQARGECAVGVVLTHGDFPYGRMKQEDESGFPLYGITTENEVHIALQAVRTGRAPMDMGGTIRSVNTIVTSGNYIAVVSGTGVTVREAANAAYKVVGELDLPSNLGYRTDIGDRLRREIPKLQALGYAKGLAYV